MASKLSSLLMADLLKSGLLKKSVTAPTQMDQAGVPAQVPATIPPQPDPAAQAQSAPDPNALAAMLSAGAPPGQGAAMPVADPNAAPVMDPNAMPVMDPNAAPMPPGMDPSVLVGLGAQAPMPMPMPPQEMTPPIETDDEESAKREEKLIKALEDLTDQIKDMSDRVQALERERDTEKEWSALDGLGDAKVVEPDADKKESVFHKLGRTVFGSR